MVFLLASCTDEARTFEVLTDSGFSNIQTTGYAAFSCGEGDSFATGFVATNPNGKRVSGVVCCGLLKSCTVRF